MIVPGRLLSAQRSEAVELEAAFTHIRLDRGTASAAATSVSGGAIAIRWWLGSKAGLVASITYAPGSDGATLSPGIAAAQVAVRLRPVHGSWWALSLGFGGGPIRFAADEYQRRLAGCTPSVGCLWEGPIYQTGWRVGLQGDVAAEAWPLRRVGVIVGGSVHGLPGSGPAGPRDGRLFPSARAGILLRF